MSSIHAARQLVLARLGTPAPLRAGERYRYRSPRLEAVYRRFDRYIEEALITRRPSALVDFIVALEAERERDYEAFHYGRELLLDNLEIHVEFPQADPDPTVAAEPLPPTRSCELPRWSRRRPAKTPRQLRAIVLERLGRPHPRLPGESRLIRSTVAIAEVRELIDSLEHTPLSRAVIEDAIAQIASLRERDWQAFCFGRAELLSLLPIECEVPIAPAAGFALGPAA
jgi:hypothetical protein